MTNLTKSGTTALVLGSAFVAALGALAGINAGLALRAERKHPPKGPFVDVNGVRLHCVTRGSGPCLVLLHGNSSMIEDFECSGILDSCSSGYQVIAFDRPGYGHSPRDGLKAKPPEAQADLIAAALSKMGVDDAIVLGHSWGTLVALQLAFRHPSVVRGLVLAAGYYFPTARPDVMMASVGTLPVIGSLLCHTLLPVMARFTWPAAVRNLFFPAEVPKTFGAFPRGLALRPSQMRTSAEESALMIPSTKGLADMCKSLRVPVALVCGAGDQVVDPSHSGRLHRLIPNATVRSFLFSGHMVHHTSRVQVEELINDVARLANQARAPLVAE